METNKKKSGEEIPITSENLHELISRIPQKNFDRNRKKLEKLMAESEKFWAEREKESRKNEDTGD